MGRYKYFPIAHKKVKNVYTLTPPDPPFYFVQKSIEKKIVMKIVRTKRKIFRSFFFAVR